MAKGTLSLLDTSEVTVGNTTDSPVPVVVINQADVGSAVVVTNEVEVKNDVGNPLSVLGVNSLVPAQYNRIDLTYNPDGTVATAVYKQGATTVATLALGYTAGNLTSVART